MHHRQRPRSAKDQNESRYQYQIDAESRSRVLHSKERSDIHTRTYHYTQSDAMVPVAIHVAMSPATIRVVRPLCGSRLAAAAVASSSSAAAGAAAASHAVRRRAAAAAAAVAAPRRRLSSSTTATTTTTKTNSEAEAGLSTLGTLFFGGLCASTFGLGCWQSVRYFEKMDQMQVRDDELKAPPVQLHRFTAAIADSNTDGSDATNDKKRQQQHEASFRRLFATGAFDHSREMLVGPRGPPPGALSSTGPSSGRSSGGMSSSPQGYYVVTPLRIAGSNNNSSHSHSHTILVNRGWVPMSYVKQRNAGTWSRPNGIVKVVGVETSAEQPRFLSPVHDARTPNRLLWMDRKALEERTSTAGQHPLLLTETETVGAGAIDDGAAAVPGAAVPVQVPPPPPAPTFPVRPTAETVGEFKVTPFTHAGYAVTWYGLSAAGMVMTRKLLTRGRT